jgi:PGM1 C-terminal domain
MHWPEPWGRPFHWATGQAGRKLWALGTSSLTEYDLVDIAVVNGLHFHGAMGEGVAFHLIGALSEFGKLGVVCIGRTQERADALFRRTVEVVETESVAVVTPLK